MRGLCIAKEACRAELLAESLCNQKQLYSNADYKTDASAMFLRRRWYKRGTQQLLK
jgi:hypothetical protein